MSPQFASVGGFSSNAFNQMPTATAPTQSSSATYPPMNARATINTNGYGRFCECVHDCTWIDLCVRYTSLTLLILSDGSQSGTQFPSRAAEAVWPQWQAQQHSQSSAEQHPHAQGNQQDMFPVSLFQVFSNSVTTIL